MVGVAVVLAWPGSAWAAGDLGVRGVQYLSSDEMSSVAGGDSMPGHKCSTTSSHLCSDIVRLCTLQTHEGQQMCWHVVLNNHYVCQQAMFWTCYLQASPCASARWCNADWTDPENPKCNYGLPEEQRANWWCNKGSAVCDSWMGYGNYPNPDYHVCGYTRQPN
jgi:hypothetical protein